MIYDPNASIAEKAKLDEYLKLKIQETFNLFIQDKKGFVDKKEIPYIMRYLGKFPSEAQVSKTILPHIEEDEPSDYIRYSKFESFMLGLLKTNEYDPDDSDTLLAAFRVLDQENKGYIEVDMMRGFLQTQGINFRATETEDFIKFATNNDPNATVIYYEDYVLRLHSFVSKHLDSFCTPQFFFNASQRYPYLVYDFREKQKQYLKNTVRTQNVLGLAETADLENFLNYPEIDSEKKKLQGLFKNRKRNFNFFVPFEESDMFSLFIISKIRTVSRESMISVPAETVVEWCHKYEEQFHKKKKQIGRSQSIVVRGRQKCNTSDVSRQPSNNLIQDTTNRDLDIDQFESNTQITVVRSKSQPHLVKSDQSEQVYNYEMFQMIASVVAVFQNEKFRSVYIIIEPWNMLFQNYPFLNYGNRRNKSIQQYRLAFLDKTFPNEIIENQLYLGAAEHAKDVDMLQEQLKVTHIVNATIEVKNYCDKVDYLNVRIYDEPQVQINEHFNLVYEYVFNAIQNQGKVLIHCAQGKSRSACFVVMFLMRFYKWDFDYTYQYVQDKREIVQINEGFIEQLQALKA